MRSSFYFKNMMSFPSGCATNAAYGRRSCLSTPFHTTADDDYDDDDDDIIALDDNDDNDDNCANHTFKNTCIYWSRSFVCAHHISSL